PNQIRGGPARKFRHYLIAVEDVMAIESRWTARRRDFRDIRGEEMKVKVPALSLQRTEGLGRGTRCLAESVCQLPNHFWGGEMKVKIPALSLQRTEGPGRGTRWLAENVFQPKSHLLGSRRRE